MPLQIRRGTDAERLAMTQPLAQGELLFVSTLGAERLYIGNGTTLGGVQITGYTNEDAQDAAALLFSNGAHTGITFTYNDASASISAVVDLANYQGTIGATSFKGSIFADDSTLLVDAVSGTIVGPVTGNITGNVTGNLTGNVTGNLTGNSAGTHTGAVVGDVTGNLTGNSAGTHTGAVVGDVTGYHTGDVKGSVFGDDSTILVDAVSGTLRTSAIVLSGSNITTSAVELNIGTPANPLIDLNINTQHNQVPVKIYGSVAAFTGSFQGPFTERLAYRGTLASPQTIQDSDFISGDIANAYVGNQGIGGDGYAFVGAQGFGHEAGTPILSTSNFARGFWFVALSDGATVDFNNALTFRPNGAVSAPILQAIPKTTIQVNAITPDDGMIVFDTDTNQFKGYNGTAWVVLG